MYEIAIVGVQFLWGLLVKRAPFLTWLPNHLIPYTNLALAFLAKIWAPEPAHAGFFGMLGGITSGLGWLMPIMQTIMARQLHETFIRPIPGAKP